MSDMINLCGLWKGKTKAGKPYLSGKLTYGARLLVFPNENKSERGPDYNVVIAPIERDQQAPRDESPREDAGIPF